jgi:hypothetical protein
MKAIKSKYKPSILRLGSNSKDRLDGGLCLQQESSISLSQSPYEGLLNMCLDDGGLPIKRQGQSNLNPTSLGATPINGIYENYKGKAVVTWGTSLYMQTGSSDLTSIYSPITNCKAFFYVANSILYMINGHEFLKYDGTTVSVVTPYIPRVAYNGEPDAYTATNNQVDDESWNLIGTGFHQQFNGDGTNKVFTLKFKGLNAEAITAVVDGVPMVETTNFTVDRVSGVVTFVAVPSKSGILNPNNIDVTAHKDNAGYANQIINCSFACEYKQVMFLSGNSNMPNSYFAGGINENNEANYFPKNRVYNYGGIDKAVTGFKPHYEKLIVFKEDRYASIISEVSPAGNAVFTRTDLDISTGCDMPGSIQVISNYIVWCNTTSGVQLLESSLIPGEKNNHPLSLNINGDTERPGLLNEPNLKSAISVDFSGKYILCLPNGHVYAWDYIHGFMPSKSNSMKWYLWDNIFASCFFIRNNILMYGHSQRGQLCQFIDVLNDFGVAINAYLSLKTYDFDAPEYYKNISRIDITPRANIQSAIQVSCVTDEDTIVESLLAGETTSIDIDNLDMDNLTFNYQTMAPTLTIAPFLQDIRYLRLEFVNNNLNENLSLIDIAIIYAMTRRI